VAVAFMYVATASLALRIVGGAWGEFVEAQLPGMALGVLVGATAMAVRLVLEGAGAGSGAVFAGILAACVLALPAGLYLMPGRVRPDALFQRLATRVARLPGPLQHLVGRMLHLHAPGAAA
jgi:hypothetical protein